MELLNRKEKYLIHNTLNVVPFLLQDEPVLIDLRNETSVAGRLCTSDGSMNIHLADAVYIDRNGLQYPFEEFMVRERMIRYIHIPPHLSMDKVISDWIAQGQRRRERPRKPLKATFKQKRAETRHKEILQQIQKKQPQP